MYVLDSYTQVSYFPVFLFCPCTSIYIVLLCIVITDAQQLSEDRWDLSRCVSELEATLKEVLSDVLEVEMKALYEDLWLEVKKKVVFVIFIICVLVNCSHIRYYEF